MPNYQQLFSDAQRQQAIANALSQRAMAPPQHAQGPVVANTGIADALGMLGQALAARRSAKKADSLSSQAEQAKREAQAAALRGLSGQQDPNMVGPPAPVNPYAQAQGAIDAGINPGVVQQYMQNQQPSKPDLTDDMKEYRLAVEQGFRGSFPDYLMALKKAGATSVNLRNEGTIPTGYTAERDAQGNIVRYVPVPGGPAAAKEDAARKAEEARREGEVSRSNILTQDIDRALSKLNSGVLPDTGFGAILKGVPGTDAKAIDSLLTTVKANIGFDQLNRMRQQSPTGGALGNVTEREIAYLQSVAGNLDQSQDKQQLVDNLNRLWNAEMDVIHGPGNGPPRRPLSFQEAQTNAAPRLPEGVTEEDIQHTMQLHGLSREEVLRRLGNAS